MLLQTSCVCCATSDTTDSEHKHLLESTVSLLVPDDEGATSKRDIIVNKRTCTNNDEADIDHKVLLRHLRQKIRAMRGEDVPDEDDFNEKSHVNEKKESTHFGIKWERLAERVRGGADEDTVNHIDLSDSMDLLLQNWVRLTGWAVAWQSTRTVLSSSLSQEFIAEVCLRANFERCIFHITKRCALRRQHPVIHTILGLF